MEVKMRKVIQVLIIAVVIALLGLIVSCSVPSQSTISGESSAIEAVKDSLTTDVVGSFKAVEYEGGYVVNFDDMAYWYVEGGKVWSLNGFAKTYAQNTEYKYGIDWEDLF